MSTTIRNHGKCSERSWTNLLTNFLLLFCNVFDVGGTPTAVPARGAVMQRRTGAHTPARESVIVSIDLSRLNATALPANLRHIARGTVSAGPSAISGNGVVASPAEEVVSANEASQARE